MVCRIYKALFTFSLVGLLSTYFALSLDLLVRRRQIARGKYGVMQDLKLHEQDIAEPRASGGPLPTGPSYPYSTRQNLSKQPTGYVVPEEQVSYGNEYHSGYHQEGGKV
ncbi:MAG: hypothetical protein M1836_008124 [Candelina mexicana]|nr:MAG: hypothetical protein M1836_008124 [Candelina mexicana]